MASSRVRLTTFRAPARAVYLIAAVSGLIGCGSSRGGVGDMAAFVAQGDLAISRSGSDLDGRAPAPIGVPSATTWFWQLTNLEQLDTSHPVRMYDVDLYDVSPAAVAALKQQGKLVICYVNVGAFESWRTDGASKAIDPGDALVVGKPYAGWPGEFWMNINRPEVKLLATRRMDLAAAKGCDGVEPDNIDGYESDTGFNLTLEQEMEFDRFLIAEAHARSMSLGLKNSPSVAAAMADEFDWALTEECFTEGDCNQFSSFTDLNKAVFVAQYTTLDPAQCTLAAQLGFQLVYFPRQLDGRATFCPAK